ncbi:hypothetical protein ABFS83_08G115700 [Erythranthe nasuta]
MATSTRKLLVSMALVVLLVAGFLTSPAEGGRGKMIGYTNKPVPKSAPVAANPYRRGCQASLGCRQDRKLLGVDHLPIGGDTN